MLCNDLEEWDGGRVGARLKWEEIYVYLLLIQQKPTQHCKAIILQLKTWKKIEREWTCCSCWQWITFYCLTTHGHKEKSEEPYLIMVNGKWALSREGCYKHYQKKKNPLDMISCLHFKFPLILYEMLRIFLILRDEMKWLWNVLEEFP